MMSEEARKYEDSKVSQREARQGQKRRFQTKTIRNKRVWCGLLIFGAFTAFAIFALNGPALAQAKYPQKTVTWLIAFGAGGGTDIFGRTTGQLLNKEGLTDATFAYENRTGGSGTKALIDLRNRHKGDEYILFPFQDVVIVPWLQGEIKENFKSFTILAGMAEDRHFIVVPAKSPFRSLKEMVAASKRKEVVIGIGSSGRFPASLFARASGIKAQMVRFEGDAEINTALLSSHIDAGFINPSGVLGQLRAGAMRAIAVAAPKRLERFPAVPTFKEEGYDVVFGLFRGIGMPPGVSDQVKNYWMERLAKLSKMEAWKTEFIDKNVLDGQFTPGPAFAKMIENDLVPIYRDVLKQEKI
jgi:putative tricarboxylic transport membrane protein